MQGPLRHKKHCFEILVVEDNPADVQLIQEGLEHGRVPCRMSVAADGEQALRCLRDTQGQSRPDLILLDWGLPRISGHEVLQAIKADELLRDIPVVVLTSSEAEGDVMGAYDLHANCYIRKPRTVEQYLEAIGALQRFWLHTATLPRPD